MLRTALPSLLLLLSAPSFAAPDPVLDLRPHWDTRTPLPNPHKGWYHHYPDNHIKKYLVAKDADLLEFPGMDHVYIRLAWAYLEPAENQYNWAVIDDIINKWTAHGLGIAFRISCRETSSDRPEQQFATPRWVQAAGAKGSHVLMGKPTSPEGPWEPDYADPVFLAKLEHFIAAFAARYDGKPWLRYVDVGSIGDWGEGHAWGGSRKECGLAVRQAHLRIHTNHFKKTQLVLSDDFVYAIADAAEREQLHRQALAQGFTYRDDSILVDGYLPGVSDTFTVRSPQFFADVFQSRPTIFELEHYGQVKRLGNWTGAEGSSLARHGKGRTGPDYFRGALRLLRASYIGYHGYAHEWLADNPELTGELLNLCGYWFFPASLSLPASVRPGAGVPLGITWENHGVAPAYHPYDLLLRLETPEPVAFTLPSGNQSWQPGTPKTETYPLQLPATLKPGSYPLTLKLRCAATARDVRLGLKKELLNQDGFYRVGTLTVGP